MLAWLNKWGLYIYSGYALMWLVGYLGEWDGLLWSGVMLALLTTALAEALEYHETRKKWHLVIPTLCVVWLLWVLVIFAGRMFG